MTAHSGHAPTIITERMILRMPILADADPYMAVLMSDRAAHMGGPMARHDRCLATTNWHAQKQHTQNCTRSMQGLTGWA